MELDIGHLNSETPNGWSLALEDAQKSSVSHCFQNFSTLLKNSPDLHPTSDLHMVDLSLSPQGTNILQEENNRKRKAKEPHYELQTVKYHEQSLPILIVAGTSFCVFFLPNQLIIGQDVQPLWQWQDLCKAAGIKNPASAKVTKTRITPPGEKRSRVFVTTEQVIAFLSSSHKGEARTLLTFIQRMNGNNSVVPTEKKNSSPRLPSPHAVKRARPESKCIGGEGDDVYYKTPWVVGKSFGRTQGEGNLNFCKYRKMSRCDGFG